MDSLWNAEVLYYLTGFLSVIGGHAAESAFFCEIYKGFAVIYGDKHDVFVLLVENCIPEDKTHDYHEQSDCDNEFCSYRFVRIAENVLHIELYYKHIFTILKVV